MADRGEPRGADRRPICRRKRLVGRPESGERCCRRGEADHGKALNTFPRPPGYRLQSLPTLSVHFFSPALLTSTLRLLPQAIYRPHPSKTVGRSRKHRKHARSDLTCKFFRTAARHKGGYHSRVERGAVEVCPSSQVSTLCTDLSFASRVGMEFQARGVSMNDPRFTE